MRCENKKQGEDDSEGFSQRMELPLAELGIGRENRSIVWTRVLLDSLGKMRIPGGTDLSSLGILSEWFLFGYGEDRSGVGGGLFR